MGDRQWGTKLKLSSLLYRISQWNFERIDWEIRCFFLNHQPGVYVSRQVRFLAKTARLQTNPDGFPPGGEIHISPRVIISDGAILATYRGKIFIDEGAFIGPYSVLYGQGGLLIGKNALIASLVTIVPGNHIFTDPDVPINGQGTSMQGIIIGDDVWIGSGARILDGVKIGRGCVIGAGAVVTKSLEEYSVAVGVPARVIRNRKEIQTLLC